MTTGSEFLAEVIRLRRAEFDLADKHGMDSVEHLKAQIETLTYTRDYWRDRCNQLKEEKTHGFKGCPRAS